jgi:hypothetical protein
MGGHADHSPSATRAQHVSMSSTSVMKASLSRCRRMKALSASRRCSSDCMAYELSVSLCLGGGGKVWSRRVSSEVACVDEKDNDDLPYGSGEEEDGVSLSSKMALEARAKAPASDVGVCGDRWRVLSTTVGWWRGGSSLSGNNAWAELGRRVATRAGSGGGPISPVEGRLEGRAVSLPDDRGREERWKGSSRRGGSEKQSGLIVLPLGSSSLADSRLADGKAEDCGYSMIDVAESGLCR